MTSGLWFVEVDKTISLILKSGLLNMKEMCVVWQEYEVKLSTSGVKSTPDSLCEFLVSSNLLTEWQCKCLKDGRHKGFFLDQYKLLTSLGPDETCGNYLAEELSTKRHVRLRITPKSHNLPQDNKIHYQVLEI